MSKRKKWNKKKDTLMKKNKSKLWTEILNKDWSSSEKDKFNLWVLSVKENEISIENTLIYWL